MGSGENVVREGERSSDQKKRGGHRGEPSPTDEFISESKTCPECGEPIHDVRPTCPNCGYEYKEEDYDNKEAGEEFVAGSQIDEHGEEIVEEGDEERPEAGNVPPRSQREREADSQEGPEAGSTDDPSEDSSDDSSDEEG